MLVKSSKKHEMFLARSGERAFESDQDVFSATAPLGGWFLPCRTGHPFAVSGSEEPSQKIEFVFSASPETIRREPQEFEFLRSVRYRRPSVGDVDTDSQVIHCRRTWTSGQVGLPKSRASQSAVPLHPLLAKCSHNPRRNSTLISA
jgi:hypothetical protein